MSKSTMIRTTVSLANPAAAIAFAGLTLAAAAGTLDSTQATRLAGIRGPGVSEIRAWNLEPTQVISITADFHRQGAGHVGTATTGPLPPGAAAAVDLPHGENELGAYAVTLDAAGSLGSLVHTTWPTGGGAAVYPDAKADTELVIPFVARDADGQSSIVTIQNADADAGASAAVALELYPLPGDGTPATTATITVEPASARSLYLSDPAFAELPIGFVGWLRLRSDQPVAAQVVTDVDAGTGVSAFEGVPASAAAQTLYAPMVRFRFSGESGAGQPSEIVTDSRLYVVNPMARAALVSVTFRGTEGTCSGGVFEDGPVTLDAGAGAVFPGAPAPAVPDGCLATAVIQVRAGKVIALVSDRDASGGRAAAYTAVAAAPIRLYLPFAWQERPVGAGTGDVRTIRTGTGSESDAAEAGSERAGVVAAQSVCENRVMGVQLMYVTTIIPQRSDGCPMGVDPTIAAPVDFGSAEGRATTNCRPARSGERHPVPCANRWRVADAAPRLPAVGHCALLLPPLAAGRHVAAGARSVVRRGSAASGPRPQPQRRDQR